MGIQLPEEYHARPAAPEDAYPVAQLYSAQSRWLNGVEEAVEARAEEMRSDWSLQFFNPQTDSLVVFSADQQAAGADQQAAGADQQAAGADQQVAGYADFFDVRAPHVTLIGTVLVHPDHLRRGIGSFLAEWIEQRARANLPKAPADARVVLQQTVLQNNQAAIELLTRRGYHHARSGYRMRIDFDSPPAAPILPEGIEIRPIRGEEEERQALFVRYESFLDHRGAVQEPFEDYYQRWKDILAHDKFHDPALWFLALENGEPAGAAVSYSFTEDDPQMGWVESLGVRRAWRKRGLGLALLQTSFRALYARGCLRAGLGVDASSLTGATRLYERAGMRVERTFLGYQLELQAGQELTKQD